MSVPRWERYKHFFQITIFRYLVLWFSVVPIVVTLLQGLQRPLMVNIGGTTVALELALPFSWQILWLSALLFLCAFAIYYLRCPAFIKRYNQYTEYKAYSHDPRWLAHEATDIVTEARLIPTFVHRLTTKKYIAELPHNFQWDKKNNPAIEEQQTRLFFEHAGKKFALATPVFDQAGNVLSDAERGIFWEIFARFSSSRLISRVAILTLLTLSGLCFLFVLLEHIWFGIGQLRDWASPLLQHIFRWLLGSD